MAQPEPDSPDPNYPEPGPLVIFPDGPYTYAKHSCDGLSRRFFLLQARDAGILTSVPVVPGGQWRVASECSFLIIW